MQLGTYNDYGFILLVDCSQLTIAAFNYLTVSSLGFGGLIPSDESNKLMTPETASPHLVRAKQPILFNQFGGLLRRFLGLSNDIL